MDFLWSHLSQFVLYWLLQCSWMVLAVGVVFAVGAVWIRESASDSRYWWSVICLALVSACIPIAAVVAFQFQPARTALVHHETSHTFGSIDHEAAEADPAKLDATNSFDKTSVVNASEMELGIISSAASAPTRAATINVTPRVWALPAWVVHWVAIGYLTGVVAMLMRILLAGISCWRLISKARIANESVLKTAWHAASRLGIKRLPTIKVSQQVVVPLITGILQPIILLPVSLTTNLSAMELQAIRLHELVHFRRHDHWIRVVQRVVETCLFFHPVVWMVSRYVERQRELSCDDQVLNAGVSSTTYAHSLLHAAAFSISGRPMKTAVGAVGTKPSFLKQRIERIIGTPSPNASSGRAPRPVLGRPISVAAVFASVSLWAVLTLYGATARTNNATSEPEILQTQQPFNATQDDELATETFPALQGVVRDHQGNALAGVAVMMQEHPQHGLEHIWRIQNKQWIPKKKVAVLKEMITDEQGRFRFSDVPVPSRSSYINHTGPVTIVAVHPKLALAWEHVSFRTSNESIELKLSAPSLATVSVHSEKYNPVSNLTAQLIGCMDVSDWERNKQHRNAGRDIVSGLRTLENLNGPIKINVAGNEVSIPQLPEQMVAVIQIQCDDHVPTICYVSNISQPQRKKLLREKGHFYGSQNGVEFRSPLVSPARLQVTATVDLTLNLSRSGKSPLANISVTSTDGELIGTSNVNGQVILSDINPLEPLKLIVSPPLDNKLQAQRVELKPDEISSEKPIDVSLAPGRLLAGRILDKDTQQGVPNAKIGFGSTMLSEPNAHLETQSAADGSFQMIVPDQNGTVFVARLDGFQTRDARLVITSETRGQQVVLDVQKYLPHTQHVCRFRIVDEQQNSVVGAKVRFFQISSRGSYGQLDSVRTGSQGYLDVAANEIFGRDREFVMIVQNDKKHTGAIYRFNRPDQVKTWNDSEQYIRNLASNLAADAPVMSAEIVLKPLLKLEGTVVDKKTKQPLANATVSLSQLIKYQETGRGPSVYTSALTDQNGNYSLSGFARTAKTISVRAKNYRAYRNGSNGKVSIAMDTNSALKHLLVHEDESHNINPIVETQLGKPLFPTESFQVTVVDYESGDPIAGAKIESLVKFDGSRISMPILISDQDGKINLKDVPQTGDYKWQITHDGYHSFGWRPAYLKKQEFELLSAASYQRFLQIGRLQLPDTTGMTNLQAIRRLSKSFERSEERNRNNRPEDPMKRFIFEMKQHPSSLYLKLIDRIAFPASDQPVDRDAQFEALTWLLQHESMHSRSMKVQRREKVIQFINQFADHPDIKSVFISLNNSSSLSAIPSWTERETFYAKVADENPNRSSKGHAVYQLAELNRTISRGWGLYSSVRPVGVEAMQQKQRGYLEQILREFADVKYASTTLGEIAKSHLSRLDQFGIGGTPPNLSIMATRNQQLKLHDLRGRYTLIHYWNGNDKYPQELLPLTQNNEKIQLVTIVYGTNEHVAELTAGWQTLVIIDPVRSHRNIHFGSPTPNLSEKARDQRNILIDPDGKIVSAKLSPEELYFAVNQKLSLSPAK